MFSMGRMVMPAACCPPGRASIPGTRRGGVGPGEEPSVVGEWAPLLQIFWPLMMKSSPSATAVVFSEARSDPALGCCSPARN
jgi:hypothetical protein